MPRVPSQPPKPHDAGKGGRPATASVPPTCINETIAVLIAEAAACDRRDECRGLIAGLAIFANGHAAKPSRSKLTPDQRREKARIKMAERRQKLKAAPPPSPKSKHPGRPIMERDDGKEQFRERKRRNAAARRARLRAQAATAAEAKPQTDNDNVNIKKAAAPAEPKPKPSKAAEFQQWREQRNDTPVLDNSLVAS